MTTKVRKPKYSPQGKMAFAVVIEMLEIIGFVIGFYAVVALPQDSMKSDITNLTEKQTWQESFKFVKDELQILVDSSIESRTLGFVAMVFIVIAFVLRTIVSRIIKMPSDL